VCFSTLLRACSPIKSSRQFPHQSMPPRYSIKMIGQYHVHACQNICVYGRHEKHCLDLQEKRDAEGIYWERSLQKIRGFSLLTRAPPTPAVPSKAPYAGRPAWKTAKLSLLLERPVRPMKLFAFSGLETGLSITSKAWLSKC